jgi:segregation and condensation protein A
MTVAVKLEIFEGPLDLLLHLIRKNEVDIYDIPIAMITHQYLEYLDLMKEMNIDLAGEFLVMASTLTHIKSRLLLPSHGASPEDEESQDPRTDLVEQLKEHMRFKAAAEELAVRPWLGRDVFARSGGHAEVADAAAAEEPGETIVAGLFELIEAFYRLMQSRGHQLSLRLPGEKISLEERMSQIIDLLKQKKSCTFIECFAGDSSKSDLVVTFLALLELARLALIKVYQERLALPAAAGPGWGTLRIYFHPEENGEGGQ